MDVTDRPRRTPAEPWPDPAVGHADYYDQVLVLTAERGAGKRWCRLTVHSAVYQLFTTVALTFYAMC